MKTFLPIVVLALVVGCQDLDGPAEPSLLSDPAAARASGSLLAAPSNTSAFPASEIQIDVGWQDNSSNETGLEIHRSTTGVSGAFSLLTTTSANVVVYSDQGLEPGTPYCYRVRAARVTGNKASYSPFSKTVCATPPLAAPSNTNASAVSESQIDLSWQDNSTHETVFQVHRSTTGVGGPFSLITTTAANVVVYSDQGLASGREYCYQVRAAGWSGNNGIYSAFSNTACAMTPPPSAPPAAASATTAAPVNSSTVWVGWTDNSTNEDGFRIYRSTDGGAVWDLAGTTTYRGFNDDGRQSEQTVCYRVEAFNVAGSASPSNMACTIPPAGPTDLTLTTVDTETVRIAWNDNSTVEDGYQLWGLVWVASGVPTCRCEGICNADIYTEERVIVELPPNSTVYYLAESCSIDPPFYVVATKDGGTSDASNSVSTDPGQAP